MEVLTRKGYWLVEVDRKLFENIKWLKKMKLIDYGMEMECCHNAIAQSFMELSYNHLTKIEHKVFIKPTVNRELKRNTIGQTLQTKITLRHT